MKVTLAGYNLDKGIIDAFRELAEKSNFIEMDSPEMKNLIDQLDTESITPETLSAAYARISRSDKNVTELRREARASVARARRSNENIIFGLGHASVAEHASFNFDVSDISRLALEELESHRLASYTEASQRYIAMSGDYIVPAEIMKNGLEDGFIEVCNSLFAGYREISEKIEEIYKDKPKRDRRTKAREDARYVLPLSCRGQVGMTINARVAEQMIKTFSESSLGEVRQMGRQMLNELRGIVPSLVKYTDPNDEKSISFQEIEFLIDSDNDSSVTTDSVMLISSPDELQAITALLFRVSNSNWEECRVTVDAMSPDERYDLLKSVHKYIGEHDSVRREMELGYFTFVLNLSSSAFAQLKRHRMSTIIKQPYSPGIGVTVPDNIIKCGAEKVFNRCIDVSNSAYETIVNRLGKKNPDIAAYVLTNAHHRRVIFQANARELTHLSRLREDKHAQWDIRKIASKMIDKARKVCPGLMMFCAGKDTFDELHRTLYEIDKQ